MTRTNLPKPLIWGLLLAFCAIWFYMLGARTLVPTDEGRYAEMAREMAATGDWVTPRLNGIKYFEKPPLQTWMNALTFKMFGLGEWQARLWTGLCGLFGIFLTAHAGKKVFGAAVGFNAAVVLASSVLWYALGHINTLDMSLSAMMTLALCSLLIAQRDDAGAAERRNWMLACWAGMALAVMSKGLIGVVLPGAVLVLYSAFSRDWAVWKRLHPLPGIPVFLAITVPWFVLVSIRNPEFPQFFFIHEHLQRFTSKVHNRAGPWYYFIPILLLGICPWLGSLLQSLWMARTERAATTTDAENAKASGGAGKGTFQPNKLLLAWSAFIFVFFSVSSSKLPSYILPIFPALALMIACRLETASARTMALTAALFALLCAVGLAFVPRIEAIGDGAFEGPFYDAYARWVMAALLVGTAGGAVAAWLARRRTQWAVQSAILTLAAAGFVFEQFLLIGHESFGRYASGAIHLAAIEAELGPRTPLYVVGRYEQVLPFYLRRTMTLVKHADEMRFGLEQEPQLWIPELDDFVRKWTADRAAGIKAVAILNPAIYAAFMNSGVPMRVVAQDPRRVIVTNGVSSLAVPGANG